MGKRRRRRHTDTHAHAQTHTHARKHTDTHAPRPQLLFQIALASPDPMPNLRRATVMGAEHHMFLYSHLGYGLMAGRGQMFGFEYSDGDPHVTGTTAIS